MSVQGYISPTPDYFKATPYNRTHTLVSNKADAALDIGSASAISDELSARSASDFCGEWVLLLGAGAGDASRPGNSVLMDFSVCTLS